MSCHNTLVPLDLLDSATTADTTMEDQQQQQQLVDEVPGLISVMVGVAFQEPPGESQACSKGWPGRLQHMQHTVYVHNDDISA